MTNKQRLALIRTYKKHLKKLGCAAERAPGDRSPYSHYEARSHCLWMLEQMPELLKAKKFQKFERWLGFVQGVLWATEINTIDELRAHNRHHRSTAAAR